MQYSTLTIIALLIYVGLVTLIGIVNRKSKSSKEYFFANRVLPPWLLCITFIASWWGGGSAIDLVDHAYTNGLSSFWIYGVAVLVATGVMWLLASSIRKFSAYTQPELLQNKYGKLAGMLMSVFILIFMILNIGVQVIVIAKMFSVLFNISYLSAALIGTIAVLIYSFFGGFKGVVLTDLLQFCFFLISTLILFYLTYSRSGGMEVVLTEAKTRGIVGFNDFWHDIRNNLAYVLTFGASWAVQANVWQRISAARNEGEAKKMMGFSFFLFIPLYLLVTYTGMFALPMFETLPKEGIVMNIIAGIKSPALSILLFVGLCSAIMSTMDSLINTASMTVTLDLWKHHWFPEASQKELVLVGRVSTLIITAIGLIIGLKIQSVVQVSWIGSDFITTGAFIPLLMCFVIKKFSYLAAVGSMIWGILFSSYNLMITLGLDLPHSWKIGSVHQALIGMGISFVLFVLLSLLSKRYNSFSNNIS